MKINKLFLLFFLAGFFACTDLEETLNQDLTADEARKVVKVDALLQSAYDGLRGPIGDVGAFWGLQEHSSDELLGPTRGPDWDDNGAWRALHDHTWTADLGSISNTFNGLLQTVFNTTNVLSFDATPQQAAEARLLRAFTMFAVADGWNQVPFRQPGENLLLPPAVLNGADALDFVIKECNEIIVDLPDGPIYKANKNAAKVLLMKCHLNKGTFANRAAPAFDGADMTQVVSIADQIIGSGAYSLEDSFFDNFAPNNDAISSENIWSNENRGGVSSGPIRARWMSGLHYNQNPSGWNGFATMSDFYDSFEDGDVRKEGDYPGMTDVHGIKVGFLEGQQYDENGTALMDRKGNALAFTREVALIEPGNNLEITGIRQMKYVIDYVDVDNPNNDEVFYRYADVLLMKAEALLRNADAAGALAIVNEVRAARNASTVASANFNLDVMLAERGRELCFEGFRRQDLIRFGKFLEANQTKPNVSGPERLLFPIPASALSVNPNLVQNPGY